MREERSTYGNGAEMALLVKRDLLADISQFFLVFRDVDGLVRTRVDLHDHLTVVCDAMSRLYKLSVGQIALRKDASVQLLVPSLDRTSTERHTWYLMNENSFKTDFTSTWLEGT